MEEKPASSIDPEDMRFNTKTNSLVWISEGACGHLLFLFCRSCYQTADLSGNFVNSICQAT
jgi:hypothetical protein